MSTEIEKIDEQAIEAPAEVFPEDGVPDKELIRMLREELGKRQADVNTSFRERQRQTVINEIVAERNEARNISAQKRSDVGADIVNHLFRVLYREELLNEKIFKSVSEAVEAAISEYSQMNLDPGDPLQTSALGEVFRKYYEKLSEAKEKDTFASNMQKMLPDAVNAAPTETADEELTWEKFVENL